MRQRYRLYRRKKGGRYYIHDDVTGKQDSLHTTDRATALRLFHSRSEAQQQPAVNLQIARAFLAASDPQIATRNWQFVMEEMVKLKKGETQHRWQTAIKDKAFDLIRHLPILETRPENFLRVLETGKVSTNVYLRRIHNFALDMTWLPWPVIVKRQWPKVEFKDKRAITWEEHQAIVTRELNPERKAFYKLAWHLGASQSDLAFLEAENVDWENHVISYARKKTGSIAIMRFDEDMAEILRDLPGNGPLFPYLRSVRAGDRATEFKQRCVGLKIKGVTLHSYRYAWAERAKTAGYHSIANVPYIFAYVNGTNLTVSDTSAVYAQALSHEIAETVVDPAAGDNPEVCDASADNCKNLILSFFDAHGQYIVNLVGSAPKTYRFYINAIVRPGLTGSDACLLNKATGPCNYAPPMLTPVSPAVLGVGNEVFFFVTNTNKNFFYNRAVLGQGGQGWTKVSDGLQTDAAIGAGVVNNNYVFLAAKGLNGLIYINQVQIVQGQNPVFVGWAPIQGLVTSVGPAVLGVGNEVFFFATDANKNIFYNRSVLGQGGQGWKEIPGGFQTDAAITAGVVNNNYVFLAAKGLNGLIYINQVQIIQGLHPVFVGWAAS